MNRRLKTLITSFLAALMMAAVLPFGQLTAQAATARISFSDPSAGVGQEFTVSVKVTTTDGNLGASDVMLSYDQNYIEFVGGNNASGGAGSVRLIGTMDSDTTTVFSYNLKFKAIQAGNTAISVGSYEVYDSDTQAVDVTKVGSSAVKIQAPASFSGEAALSSLKVSPGGLNPAFSPDVTSYTVNVGGDVNKLAVSATAKDGKAKVVVSDCSLKTGLNTIICKVTAEDGQTTRSYTLAVNRSDSVDAAAGVSGAQGGEAGGAVLGELKADIDGVEYSVAQSFDAGALPAGYTQATCTYAGNEIMCGTGNGLTLIYLQSSDGNGGFYIYEPESGALSPYVTIDVSAKSIVVLPTDETVKVPEGFAPTVIQLNGDNKVSGWVWESDEAQNYCVVYGMNESGEKGLYRYDIAEKTFQRYFEDPALKNSYSDEQIAYLVEEYNSLRKDYNIRFIIIVALIAVCLILFFMVVNLLLRRRDHRGGGGYPPGREEESPTPVRRRAMQEEEMRGNRQQPQGRMNYTGEERRAGGAVGRGRDGEPYQSGGRTVAGRPEPARGYRPEPERVSRPEQTRGYRPESESGYGAEPYRSTGARPAPSVRQSEPERGRNYRDYDLRGGTAQDDGRRAGASRPERGRQDIDREELMREREIEREERARRARERLERERLEDERRARAARTGRASGEQPGRARAGRRDDDEDDFEFLNLE